MVWVAFNTSVDKTNDRSRDAWKAFTLRDKIAMRAWLMILGAPYTSNNKRKWAERFALLGTRDKRKYYDFADDIIKSFKE